MHIIKWTKNKPKNQLKIISMIDELSKRLVALEYKSNHSIKSKYSNGLLKML